MALIKLEEFYPNYAQDLFGGKDIKGFDVYAGLSDEKIGSLDDALVDEAGRFRYLVIDTGFWIFGKKVLLPVGRSSLDYAGEKLNAIGLTNKEQAEALPEYKDDMVIDYDYEERVRANYRTSQPSATYNRNTYDYNNDSDLYALDSQKNGKLKLYEERLIAEKFFRKTGDVVVSKKVETETEKVSVPVEKERVVIERSTPSNVERAVPPGEATFKEGEVARVEVYEETAKISKEAYVREEVSVKKEVDRDVVTAEEQLRREELNVKDEGQTVVNR